MTTLHILIIEDTEADYLLIARHLRTSGLNAALHWVTGKTEMIAALDERHWNLVLSDYKVPGLDFLYSLELIKNRLPHVPVILVSGSIGEETAVDLLKIGLADFVLKDRLFRLVPAIERSLGEVSERRKRRQAEAELKQQKEQYRLLSQEYRTLLDNIPDGIIQLAPDLTILWTNAAAQRILGLPNGSFAADKCCHEVFWNLGKRCEACPVVRSLHSHVNELGCISPDGKGTELEIRAVPIINESGSLTSVIEIIREVSAHRRLEEQFRQAQKMESIGTFAGGIAHDFNNILSAILGYGEIALEDMAEDHPAAKSVRTILEAGLRASHLTKDLLMFSRKQVSKKDPVDLNELIARIEKFIRRIIGEDIQFEIHLAKQPLPLLVDSHQIDQVLMNFATNARDAMPDGGLFVFATKPIEIDQEFIDSHGFGRPGAYVRLRVSDTGKGMDKESMAKIFDPFFTTKEMGKGTGLGMAVVYGIIMEHQGHITVASEPGRGTNFDVYFPLLDRPQAKTGERLIEVRPTSGNETILLAEDDWNVRELFARTLERAGYHVLTAINGEEAVEIFKTCGIPIDLLVFDLIMPKMNGKLAMEAIQQIQPDIKGVFVSGYAPENIRQKDLLDLKKEILFKPALPKELLRTVQTILAGH